MEREKQQGVPTNVAWVDGDAKGEARWDDYAGGAEGSEGGSGDDE
jgi:hypothetical protein